MIPSRCRFATLALTLALSACAPAPGEAPAPGGYHLQAVQAGPAVTGLDQTPLKIPVGGRGTLDVRTTGTVLTYSWRAAKGTITGSGAHVTYIPDQTVQQPNSLDDQVTVTVSDGKATASRTFTVDTFLGTQDAIQATDALQWAPAKTAYARVWGNVTAHASGDFSIYNAVIAEYSTAHGRQMALLPSGATVLPGVTGNVFLYLIGPATATPNISVNFANGMTRTVTRANVVASNHVGYQPLLGPGNAGFFADVTTAKNGANAYQTLLDIRTEQGKITYTLLKPGGFFFGFDPRLASGDADERVVLTDSLGGTGDNTGAWTIDNMAFDQ